MNNKPSFIKQGIKLSTPQNSLTYSGYFCECGSPLYKINDKIICKGCPSPRPKRKT